VIELNLNLVKLALLRMLAHYPESGHNGKTIAPLAEDYLEDFTAERLITLEQLNLAISLARRRSSFFLKSAQIIAAHEELLAKGRSVLPRQIAQTSEWKELSESQIALNKKLVAINAEVVAKKITWKEGERRQLAIIKQNKGYDENIPKVER
jgi:hypothetical protein